MTQHHTQTEIETTLKQMYAKRQHIIDNNLNVDIRFIEEDILSFECALTEITDKEKEQMIIAKQESDYEYVNGNKGCYGQGIYLDELKRE